MVRLVVGLVDLQQLQALVDRRRQSRALGQQVHGADPAGGEAAQPIAALVVKVAAAEHRLQLSRPVSSAQPPPNSPLATRRAFLYC